MKLYGYSKKKLRSTGLRELKEVTLVAQPEVFLELAKFLRTQARLMKKHPSKYGHAHFEYKIGEREFWGLIVVPQTSGKSRR